MAKGPSKSRRQPTKWTGEYGGEGLQKRKKKRARRNPSHKNKINAFQVFALLLHFLKKTSTSNILRAIRKLQPLLCTPFILSSCSQPIFFSDDRGSKGGLERSEARSRIRLSVNLGWGGGGGCANAYCVCACLCATQTSQRIVNEGAPYGVHKSLHDPPHRTTSPPQHFLFFHIFFCAQRHPPTWCAKVDTIPLLSYAGGKHTRIGCFRRAVPYMCTRVQLLLQ